jgi:hypothetical protein
MVFCQALPTYLRKNHEPHERHEQESPIDFLDLFVRFVRFVVKIPLNSPPDQQAHASPHSP